MKKLMLIALSFTASAMLYAHGPGFYKGTPERDNEVRQEMYQLHELMHNTTISGSPLDNGISLQITGASESIGATLKKRFIDDQENLNRYFSKAEVTVTPLENGVEIQLISSDETTIKQLQAYGTRTIYRYLHSSVMVGQSGIRCHRGFGRGMMGGYGPGMMGEFGPGVGVNLDRE